MNRTCTIQRKSWRISVEIGSIRRWINEEVVDVKEKQNECIVLLKVWRIKRKQHELFGKKWRWYGNEKYKHYNSIMMVLTLVR